MNTHFWLYLLAFTHFYVKVRCSMYDKRITGLTINFYTNHQLNQASPMYQEEDDEEYDEEYDIEYDEEYDEGYAENRQLVNSTSSEDTRSRGEPTGDLTNERSDRNGTVNGGGKLDGEAKIF
jgi:hypothetical protein